MQRRDLGPHGLKLIEAFESFVPYVYDDKVAMHRGANGKLAYQEWQGGPVRGTLTIGYGHTDAARHPLKCRLGTQITLEAADEVLHTDLSECIEQVNAAVKAPLTQGQFDALVSFTFNCGVGNLRRLVVPLNRGDYDVTRGDFAHYVRSKGEVMRGLERRRHAEQLLWDDDYSAAAEHHPSEDKPAEHAAEVDERPERSPAKHIDVTAGAAVVAGGVQTLSTVNDALSAAKQAHDSLTDLLTTLAGSPALWCALAVVLGAAWLWWHHRTA